MAPDPKTAAALALHRFGLGPRSGSVAAIGSDARGALLAELERPGAARITDASLPGSGAAARAAFQFRETQRLLRQAERAARADTAPTAAAPQSKGAEAAAPAMPAGPPVPQQLYLTEAKARIHAALAADIGFAERLAWFWSNHFC